MKNRKLFHLFNKNWTLWRCEAVRISFKGFWSSWYFFPLFMKSFCCDRFPGGFSYYMYFPVCRSLQSGSMCIYIFLCVTPFLLSYILTLGLPNASVHQSLQPAGASTFLKWPLCRPSPRMLLSVIFAVLDIRERAEWPVYRTDTGRTFIFFTKSLMGCKFSYSTFGRASVCHVRAISYQSILSLSETALL